MLKQLAFLSRHFHHRSCCRSDFEQHQNLHLNSFVVLLEVTIFLCTVRNSQIPCKPDIVVNII
ncbi:hypothetical protein Hanom_Chr03g00204311 [Helianthus anomalus]